MVPSVCGVWLQECGRNSYESKFQFGPWDLGVLFVWGFFRCDFFLFCFFFFFLISLVVEEGDYSSSDVSVHVQFKIKSFLLTSLNVFTGKL